MMKGKTLAQLYADLGITRTLSRPRVSNGACAADC
jgi:hypothetical protein